MTPGEELYKKCNVTGIPWNELTIAGRAYWRRQAELTPKIEAPQPVVQVAAIARPGDTILVGYDHRLSDEEFQEMTSRLRTIGDDLGIRFGVIEGASSVIVVRSEGDIDGVPQGDSFCSFPHSHTREFCGNSGCRES